MLKNLNIREIFPKLSINIYMHTHAIQDGCVSITLCFPASMTVLFTIQACCWALGDNPIVSICYAKMSKEETTVC